MEAVDLSIQIATAEPIIGTAPPTKQNTLAVAMQEIEPAAPAIRINRMQAIEPPIQITIAERIIGTAPLINQSAFRLGQRSLLDQLSASASNSKTAITECAPMFHLHYESSSDDESEPSNRHPMRNMSILAPNAM